MPLPRHYKPESQSQSANPMPNRFLNVRFDRDGNFFPEQGNTVVRPVVPGSRTEEVLIGLRARLQALPWGHRFAFTDISSLHMTLFEGVLDTRRQPDHWPADLPLDASIETMTEHFASRLRTFEGPGPFDMRIFEVTPSGLTVTGATDDDEKTARAWRDALSGVLGYRPGNHDRYTFHITLGYIIDWIPDDMIPEYRTALAELTEGVSSQLPILELDSPVLCTFADMNAFPPVLELPGFEQRP